MDDQDVAVGHPLHALRDAVPEQALDVARLSGADDYEIRRSALGDLDDRLRDLAERLDDLRLDATLAEPRLCELELRAGLRPVAAHEHRDDAIVVSATAGGIRDIAVRAAGFY